MGGFVWVLRYGWVCFGVRVWVGLFGCQGMGMGMGEFVWLIGHG